MNDFEKRITLSSYVTDTIRKLSGQQPPTVREINSGREWGVYTQNQLLNVLGQTVKRDNTNKLVVFLSLLLTYTESDQLNISFNAPSSSGKSYMALEIAGLFPEEDVIDLAYASPTSFFHSHSKYDEKLKGYVVNLERKMLVFMDMPHQQLLERLRPAFSQDKKVIHLKITDKQKSSLKTKEIFIIGYASVVFCSASFKFDEQELTRFMLLSPETSQEKIGSAISEVIRKETDPLAYIRELNENPERLELKERIRAVRDAHIKIIRLHDPGKLEHAFNSRHEFRKPRHTRDIKRVARLAKAFALLNLWNRNYVKKDSSIETTDEDYRNAFALWDDISEAQDLGLPPHVLMLFREIILAAFKENGGIGLTRQDIVNKHYQVYGRHVEDFRLRKEYLPMLVSSGLISEEQDKDDRRILRIYPLVVSTISDYARNSDMERSFNAAENSSKANILSVVTLGKGVK